MQEKQIDFLNLWKQSFVNQTFIKASFGGYKGTDAELKGVYVKPINLKNKPHLSFTFRYKTRDIVKNYGLEDALTQLELALRGGFRVANLWTGTEDAQLELLGSKWGLKVGAPSVQSAPNYQHDKVKSRLIDASLSTAYLHDLGICDAAGNVYKNSQDKYKQINKYIELVSALLNDLPPNSIKKVVDMGAGKGYLTFALYDYLVNRLNLTDIEVVGVEFRKDLVVLCNSLAEKHGFKGLRFVENTIENYDAKGTDVLIALHACDTATDDAILKGLMAEAQLIVCAPCCHKQVRREMEQQKSYNLTLQPMLSHGILLERQAEMLTDTLRALILECYGYKTKIFEFIATEHTPKNVLLVGSKKEVTPSVKAESFEKIKNLKSIFGIKKHYLEKAFTLLDLNIDNKLNI